MLNVGQNNFQNFYRNHLKDYYCSAFIGISLGFEIDEANSLQLSTYLC